MNHVPITKELEKLGFLVMDTKQLGKGKPDMVVTGLHRGYDSLVACLVEVKSKGGKLTDAEKKFHQKYPVGAPLIVAYNTEDILRWFRWIE